MTISIAEFELTATSEQTVNMAYNGGVLQAGIRTSTFLLWAEVDSTLPSRDYTVSLRDLGEALPSGDFIGIVTRQNGTVAALFVTRADRLGPAPLARGRGKRV